MASGLLRPITWIGNRALDAKGEALPHNGQPVRIARVPSAPASRRAICASRTAIRCSSAPMPTARAACWCRSCA
nr:hypothetical protein [Methylorubrum extorquens]